MKHTTTIWGWTLGLSMLASAGCAQMDLARRFDDPPAAAKPHTWWHWMNGNISSQGITADLEAMQEIGLGGAQIFNVSEGIPPGPVAVMSPQFRDLVKHAVSEAKRLGLEICMHNCAGWSSSGGPWVTPEHAMQMLVTSETHVSGPQRCVASLPQPETRAGFYRDIAVLAFPSPRDDARRIPEIASKAGFEARYGLQPALDVYPAEAVVPRQSVVDLTSQLEPDGRLAWDVPQGDWTLLRIGHTPTGEENRPSPDSGRGLECDKLSRAALDQHWAGMMGKIVGDVGPLAGTTLDNCLIDSYEVGHQNWTARFREEFVQRRGYDPLLFLPTITGRVVESGEVSERFLWDLRRTIADLFADNYYGYFAELCHQSGMLASIEPYDGPFEGLLAGRSADIPMGEFWVGNMEESNSCKLAASVAHTYGRRIVGAEAFTAEPSSGRWQGDPYSLKAVGDLMFSVGINRCIVHRYAHQPWPDRFPGMTPGMTMGQWGTHFERTVTWWREGRAWVRYLTRCQVLLQEGRFVADVCLFAGEAAPNGAPHDPALKASGHDYDACNADVVRNRMSVQDGRLALPDGMNYRVLVLPETRFMTPATLAKLRDLVAQGATVVGPKPLRSPSLADLPAGDARVLKMADELWGDCDGESVKEHAFGKGKVVWGRSVTEVLRILGVVPDCEFAGLYKPKMAWIHRVADGADVYFVSNQRPSAQSVECTFRVSGRVPELWHPDSGATELAPVWSEKDGRTTVSIPFEPAGSVFVVFRRPIGAADHAVAVTLPEVEGAGGRPPKIEILRAGYEAQDGSGGADVTDKVASLVRAGEVTLHADNATFGDTAVNRVKRLSLEYTLDGRSVTRIVDENDVVELLGPPGPTPLPLYQLGSSAEGRIEMRVFQSGTCEVRTARGGARRIEVAPLPVPIDLEGPWSLRFPPNWGAPAMVTLERLTSWTEHSDQGVRYFSGTATYAKSFEVPAAWLEPGRVVALDLGSVKNLATVAINGEDLGVWWKPPFAADVTKALRVGTNTLEVRVTNLWVNRLVGDEQWPADCEWDGAKLARWPQWLLDGQPRPVAERRTFTTWKHYDRDSALLPSGLLGPVRLWAGQRIAVEL
jgi:hypothetical protein